MTFAEIVADIVSEIVAEIDRQNMPMLRAFVDQVCGHGIRLGDCAVCRCDARLFDQFMTAWFADSSPRPSAHPATDGPDPGGHT